MVVTYDSGSGVSGNNSGGSSSETLSMTVGSGSHQAAVAFMNFSTPSDTLPRITCDGTPMILIPGTDTASTLGSRTIGFVVTGLAAGSHTFIASTNSVTFVVLGVASFFGVHPTRPVDQVAATFADATSSSPSVSIPNQANDMTVDCISDIPDVPGSPTQTQAWQNAGCGCSYAAGTGSNNTHSWTLSSSTLWTECAVTLKAAENRGSLFGGIAA